MNGRDEVCAEAEAFRKKYLDHQGDQIPVDVLTLCEITLRLDVIPFPGLFDKYKIDAGIKSDFSGIYVDSEAYILWEKGPTWKQNRLRFSVAHELGHFHLHRQIASEIIHDSFEKFRAWIDGHDKFPIEQEANEFAGRLLVPLNRLERYYSEFREEFEPVYPHWHERSAFRERFAERVAPKFGVNADVINIRLDREGLWPVN
jgi:Zn-dependent peptidase ImmA (M78 family)